MSNAKHVKVATAMLRRYRDYLRNDAIRSLEGIKSNIDQNRLPVDAWGVLLEGVVPHKPDPRSGQMRGGFVVTGGLPELARFKKAYETAHEQAMTRLGQLTEILENNAQALHRIAQHYDDDEERGRKAAEEAAEG